MELANWLETSKARSSTVSNFVGGPLLADIVKRLETAKEAVTNGSQVLYYYFASWGKLLIECNLQMKINT